MSLLGIDIVTSEMVCDQASFLRAKRPHRRPRIAKKWLRRFGAVMTTCRGKCVVLLGRYIACPHYMDKMKEYLAMKGQPNGEIGNELFTNHQKPTGVLEPGEKWLRVIVKGVPVRK